MSLVFSLVSFIGQNSSYQIAGLAPFRRTRWVSACTHDGEIIRGSFTLARRPSHFDQTGLTCSRVSDTRWRGISKFECDIEKESKNKNRIPRACALQYWLCDKDKNEPLHGWFMFVTDNARKRIFYRDATLLHFFPRRLHDLFAQCNQYRIMS